MVLQGSQLPGLLDCCRGLSGPRHRHACESQDIAKPAEAERQLVAQCESFRRDGERALDVVVGELHARAQAVVIVAEAAPRRRPRPKIRLCFRIDPIMVVVGMADVETWLLARERHDETIGDELRGQRSRLGGATPRPSRPPSVAQCRVLVEPTRPGNKPPPKT